MARPNDPPCTKCGLPMRGSRSRASGMCYTCRNGRGPNKYRWYRQGAEDARKAREMWPCHVKTREGDCATVLDRTDRNHRAIMQQGVVTISAAYWRAKAMGHDIPVVVSDTEPGTWIGVCNACGGFLVMDPIESPEAYGNVTKGRCPGTIYRPALRRSMLDYEPATAAASQEYADMEPEVLTA